MCVCERCSVDTFRMWYITRVHFVYDCAYIALSTLHVSAVPVQRGREEKALRALRLAYRLNHLHRGGGDHFRIKSIPVETRGADEGGVAKRGSNCGGTRVVQRLARFRGQLVQVRDSL